MLSYHRDIQSVPSGRPAEPKLRVRLFKLQIRRDPRVIVNGEGAIDHDVFLDFHSTGWMLTRLQVALGILLRRRSCHVWLLAELVASQRLKNAVLPGVALSELLLLSGELHQTKVVWHEHRLLVELHQLKVRHHFVYYNR